MRTPLLKLWVGGALLVCSALDAVAQGPAAATPAGPRVPSRFGLHFGFTLYPQFSLRPSFTLPPPTRTVPSHPDDGWFASPSSPRLIPDATFALTEKIPSVGLSVTFAPQVTAWRFTFRGGVSISPDPMGAMHPVAGDFATYRAVNQYGTTARSEGTSLVYYSIYPDRASIRPAPFGELEFRLHGFLSVLGGYGGPRREYTFLLETGYDRFGALQTYRKTKLATITTPAVPYGAIRFGSVATGVSLGVARGQFGGAILINGASAAMGSVARNQIFITLDARLIHTKRSH